MQLNVDLPQADIDFLDTLGNELGIDSRDAILERAVESLRKFVNENGLFLLTPEQWEATYR
jgi:hypothetical protein